MPIKSVIWSQYDLVWERWFWWQEQKAGQEELARLKVKMGEEAVLVAEVAQLRQENEQLRRLLGAAFPAKWQFLPSRVAGWSAGRMMINQGADQGLQTGMMVVAAPAKNSNLGVLIGRVERLHPQQAWVQTIKSQDLKITVEIRDGETANHVGEGLLNWEAGELRLGKLLPDETIKAGDVVLTSGEERFDIETGRGWLAGIPIGIVNEVSFERETDVYQTSKVSWLVDESNLKQVFVVTSW